MSSLPRILTAQDLDRAELAQGFMFRALLDGRLRVLPWRELSAPGVAGNVVRLAGWRRRSGVCRCGSFGSTYIGTVVLERGTPAQTMHAVVRCSSCKTERFAPRDR